MYIYTSYSYTVQVEVQVFCKIFIWKQLRRLVGFNDDNNNINNNKNVWHKINIILGI